MDITIFINSRDIRDYHRKIRYKYNALEAAWLVYYCRDISVKQKHEAWNWIIQNMPDCEVSNGRIHTCFYGKSAHKAIADYIEMEKNFIDSFMCDSGWLYTYSHSFYAVAKERSTSYMIKGCFQAQKIVLNTF